MLRQFLRTALRAFLKNKLFTLINMGGLVIGICAALVIFLIVRYDFGFDRFEPGVDRLYRVVTMTTMSGEKFPNGGVPGALPAALRTDLPLAEDVTAFYAAWGVNVRLPGKSGKHFKAQPNVAFADSSYFDVFGYRWLAGDPRKQMKAPGQVVLTESRMKLYFSGLNPSQVLGRTITYFDTVMATVTGVVADLDRSSDIVFEEFISYPTLTGPLKDLWFGDWQTVSSAQFCFIRLAPGVTKSKAEGQLASIRTKYAKDDPKSGNQYVHLLQPMNDVHFNTSYYNLGNGAANKAVLHGLLAAGSFLLLLACINYINLSTAQSSWRAKEIGIRKTLGSSRRQLMMQLLGETLGITLIAAIAGLVLTPAVLKIFSDFTPKGLGFHPFSEPGILGFLLAQALVVSLLAGFYPALILTGIKPVLVLKNQVFEGSAISRRAWLRRGLTVFQFVIAQVFVLGTLLVSKQISYVTHKDLGYRKTAIIFVNTPWDYSRKNDLRPRTFLNAITTIPGIKRASIGREAPASDGASSSIMSYTEGRGEIKTNVLLKAGDSNYLHVYGLRLLAGRNLQWSDTTKEYIINQTYARILGYSDPREVIGHHVDGCSIVGVVGDFYQGSLHTAIKPLAISNSVKYAHTVHLALTPTDWKRTIAQVEDSYKTIYPEETFSYTFFDESIARFYKTEQDTAFLLAWATGLSILISCLGLLGLVLFTNRVRRKEIGVRKVLGASVGNIVALLSGDFLGLVGLAFLIAVPLSWWGMHVWLADFADRTTMDWWVFAAGGGVILLAAFVTLSFQTIRAARTNPVNSLRAE